MLQGAIIVLCTMLALSSALPHHKWHWSRPDQHSETAAKAQDHEWHWNKPDATMDAQPEPAGEQSCRTAVGRLSVDGKNIQRSYHLCRQENPELEMENELGTQVTTYNYYCVLLKWCRIT